jgi:hypothetical protein
VKTILSDEVFESALKTLPRNYLEAAQTSGPGHKSKRQLDLIFGVEDPGNADGSDPEITHHPCKQSY